MIDKVSAVIKEIPPTVPSATSNNGGSAVLGLAILLIMFFGAWQIIGSLMRGKTPASIIRAWLQGREGTREEVHTFPAETEEGGGEEEGKQLEELESVAKMESEARKRLEEQLAEMEKYKEDLEEKISSKDQEVKERNDKIKSMEDESRRQARFYVRRWARGERMPVVKWTINGNPVLMQYCAGVVPDGGGYRAILVDNPRKDPEKGHEVYPPPDKPAPKFIFRDDPGFNPNDPSHSVLFDVSTTLWQRDAQVTEASPTSYPVGYSFGIDDEGNPIHSLKHGMIQDISQLRQENLKLKNEANRYWIELTKEQHKTSQLEYDLSVYKDRADSLKSENDFLRMQMYDMKDAHDLQSHEMEVVKKTSRINELRGMAHERLGKEAEERLDKVLSRPRVGGDGRGGKEIYRKLHPIAELESQNYGIDVDKYANDPEGLVKEWLSAKYQQDNMTLEDVVNAYNLSSEFRRSILGE